MFEEKGSLTEVPAIKIVLAIFEEELTGILYLKNEEALKVLYMNRGKLVWAMSNSPEDKLEDILLARGHLDNNTIESVRTEGSVSSSIGKLLVEKGHLTLEQLIDVTKIQVGRIIKSVLGWAQGGYQFVKEPPPERMFNLDINLMSFTFNYVLKEIDLTLVWREIRTVRIHLSTTTDQEKIGKYDLSEREQNFLNNFSSGTSIESVLSRYAGSHRDTLLRFVYFFLSSGLLEKLDIEDEMVPGASGGDAPVEEIGSIDNILVDEKPLLNDQSTSEDDEDLEFAPHVEISPPQVEGVGIERLVEVEDIGNISIDEPEDIGMAPETGGIDLIARLPENEESMSLEESGRYVIDDQQTMEIGEPEDLEDEGLDVHPKAMPDKKKLKQFHYLIILVILILSIGGIIFLLLPEEEIDLGEPSTASTQKTGNEQVIEVTEQTPAVKKTESTRNERKPAGQLNTDVSKKVDSNSRNSRPVAPKKQEIIAPQQTSRKKTTYSDVGALNVFRQGDYKKAGELWRQDAKLRGVKYAILLELDCQKQSVANAFKECKNSNSFYFINIRRGDRDCFLVLWGAYLSEADANAAMGLIPGYFTRQQPPARVIDLQKYL